MEAWTVVERTPVWDAAARDYWADERIVESGVTEARAYELIADRNDRHMTCAILDGEMTEEI